MATDIVVPRLGLTETHATVTRWRKAVGDPVSAGDIVVEIQADKADVDIEAPADGVVAEILVGEGVEVELGTVIGRIIAVGAPLPAAAAGAGPAGPTLAAAVRVAAPALAPGARVPSSPLARRIAAELGVALAGVVGTGPGGLVVVRDIHAAAALPGVAPAAAPAAIPVTPAVGPPSVAPVPAPPVVATAPAAAPSGPPELPGVGALRELELSRVRRSTARRLAAVTAIPAVTLHRHAGIEQARVAVAVARALGVRATLTHAVLAACAGALAKHPELNGFWVDGRLYTAEKVNLGIAVDVEGLGLLVAVAEDCAGKGIAEIAAASNRAVAEARSGQAGRGAQATFTVSNLGMLGVELFTPLLNPPETGILGVGAVVDGRIGLSLTFDHRAIDGAPAARFLDVVARELAGS